jgi:hypothetical protein
VYRDRGLVTIGAQGIDDLTPIIAYVAVAHAWSVVFATVIACKHRGQRPASLDQWIDGSKQAFMHALVPGDLWHERCPAGTPPVSLASEAG